MSSKRRGRGEGSVFERGDGTWQAALSLGVGVNGRRKRLTMYAQTKREVLEKLDKARQDAGSGVLVDAGRITVAEVIDAWLAEVDATLQSGTRHNYKKSAKYIREHLGTIRAAKLQAANVAAFYTALLAAGKSAMLVRRIGIALGVALEFAKRRGILTRNVARDARRPRVERKEPRIPTTDEVRRLLAAVADTRLEALFVLAATTGARQGELLALQWQSIDFERRTLSVVRSLAEVSGTHFEFKAPKTQSGKRVVTLPPEAVEALARHRKRQLTEGIAPRGEQLVFCTHMGGPIAKANIWANTIVPAMKRAGVGGFTFHSLRHWHATQLLAKGIPLPVVSQRLGHSNRALTLAIYSHAVPGGQDAAASVMSSVLSTENGENGCSLAVNS